MWPFRRWADDKPGQKLGEEGETLAAKHLRRKGYKILARNYRCPAGEADIIALDKSRADGYAGVVVFVEVKTRSSDQNVLPESAINQRKQGQLLRVARYYLSDPRRAELPARFDSVAVVIPPHGEPRIRHTMDIGTIS
jgi:putative endonuclease